MTMLTDDALRAMAIPARNAWLDDWAQEQYEEAQAKAEYEAEQRYERWLEDGGVYADQIAWENQEDERRAAAFGSPW